MRNTKVMKWGILGAAWIANERLIPAMKASSNGEVVGIASRNVGKAKDIAEIHGIPKVFGSYEELLNDQEIDAVYIPLPNHLHTEWTKRAANKGKHVLCEKPAALSVKEVEEMIGICRSNNVLFMEAFAFRCHPEWQRLMEIIHSGEIGEMRTVRVHYSTLVDNKSDIRFNRDMGGGSLYDLGCYCINAIRAVMEGEPEEVLAIGNFPSDKEVDISLSALMKFNNGRLAHFDCSLDTVYRQYMDITGTKGAIHIHWPFQYPRIRIQKDGKIQEDLFSKQVNPYVAMVEHFSMCALTGQPLLNSAQHSIDNMAVMEKIYQSTKATN